MPSAPLPWWIVIPVKHPRRGKSRLQPPSGVDRVQLNAAMAIDTIEAAATAVGRDRVIVVTDLAALCPHGCVLVDDPGGGLNAAVRAGIAAATARSASVEPVAVLLGDHPALRPAELADALSRCARLPSAVVPDTDGTGTALLTALDPATMRPQFGPGSAAAHSRWARLVDGVAESVTVDVDDAQSLQRARAIGLGSRTMAVLAQVSH